jgi:DNA-binding transcriptional MerR regulator
VSLCNRVVRIVVVLTVAAVVVVPAVVWAQDALAPKPAAKPGVKKFKRPTKFRKIAPDVLTTIPVKRIPEECYTTLPGPDLALLVQGDPKLRVMPKLEPVTATLRTKLPAVTFHRPIWNLEFTFKPLRMIRVQMPQPSGKLRTKLIWYMVYKVRNPGKHFVPMRQADGSYKLDRPDEIDPGKPGVNFVPFFVLVENKEIKRYFREQIIPLAKPQILRREFRAGEFKAPELLNSAEMAQVKAHVLRYWETEFAQLRPKKNRAGNRTYQEKDVQLVLLVRKLLYDDGFTIKGARKRLQEKRSSDLEQIEIPFSGSERMNEIASFRQELESLLTEL